MVGDRVVAKIVTSKLSCIPRLVIGMAKKVIARDALLERYKKRLAVHELTPQIAEDSLTCRSTICHRWSCSQADHPERMLGVIFQPMVTLFVPMASYEASNLGRSPRPALDFP